MYRFFIKRLDEDTGEEITIRARMEKDSFQMIKDLFEDYQELDPEEERTKYYLLVRLLASKGCPFVFMNKEPKGTDITKCLNFCSRTIQEASLCWKAIVDQEYKLFKDILKDEVEEIERGALLELKKEG